METQGIHRATYRNSIRFGMHIASSVHSMHTVKKRLGFLGCLFATELGPSMNYCVESIFIWLNIKIAIPMQLIHPFQNLFSSHRCNLFATTCPCINHSIEDSGCWSETVMPTLLIQSIHVLKNRFSSSRSGTSFTTLGPCVHFRKKDPQQKVSIHFDSNHD